MFFQLVSQFQLKSKSLIYRIKAFQVHYGFNHIHYLNSRKSY